ncbi:MAG: alpha-galactosidase [Actinomycetota bacterium]|nr:alpha-galactosidase [Actinomycetota bacterium]
MSTISYHEKRNTWLLEMPTSSYAIALTGELRVPRHVHWGCPIGHETAAAIAASELRQNVEHIAWAEEDRLECVGWGGRRYDEPTVKVDFADGTRGIEWHLAHDEVTRDGDSMTLMLALQDRAYPLRVELFYRIFDDTDVLERWARLIVPDHGAAVVVRRAFSANWWLPERGSWRLSFLHGGWGNETQLERRAFGSDKHVLESRRGTTSHQFQPFFALDADGTATEDHGEVWSGQLAWSGAWKIIGEQTAGGHVHVVGGWNDFDSPIVLAPGDELALPVFTGLYCQGGFGGMSRAWHDYELNHVLARPGRTQPSPSFPARCHNRAASESLPRLRPVLYNSWEATAFAVDEQGQRKLAELAAQMGVELFVVDDGWFVGRRDDRAGLGDWHVDAEKFPRGLTPLIEHVNQLNMGFGLWIEPEMVNPNSDLYRAHPDWVFHFANRARTEKRNQLVLNLARDDVAEWVFQTVDGLLSSHPIDFVKWDMNRHFSEPGWPEQSGANPERAWTAYVENLYDILDRLHDAHPTVDFESCSGGGGRVDLGILSRTRQVWTSDNTDAFDRIAIQKGFSYAHAPLAMMAWVTDSPNPLTRRELPLAYRFHVAMAGSLGIGGNLSEWTAAEREEARQLVGRYKQIRPIVQHGRLFRLLDLARDDLAAVQYVARDDSAIVVFAWSGARHYRTRPGWVQLQAIDPTASYRDRETGMVHAGATLQALGLPLPASLSFASMCVHLERLG